MKKISPKNIIRLAGLMLVVALPIILIFMWNPYNRIYSYHGFVHTGVTYQILNGNIPPLNPLIGGQPLYYNWGYHLLSAGVSRIFNITPFYSFAFINIISLCLVVLLIYKISNLLINDKNANTLSVLVSVIGISFLTTRAFEKIYLLGDIAEWRAIPLIKKYYNVSGFPVGVVFFLLFVYAVIRVFRDKERGFSLSLLFCASFGCVLVYPQLMIAMVASLGMVCLFKMIFCKREGFDFCFRRSIASVAALVAGVAVLWPYLATITPGAQKYLQFFHMYSMPRNAIKYLVATLPILVIICIGRRFILKNVNKEALGILTTIIVATLGVYLFVHMTENNEYKFLIASMVVLGILGGIAFRGFFQRYNKIAVAIVLIMFLMPAYVHYKIKFEHLRTADTKCIEKGVDAIYAEPAEGEMYAWIRQNTHRGSMFIDTVLTIPVFAQRQLFIAMEQIDENGKEVCTTCGDKFQMDNGYNICIPKMLRDIWGYQSGLLKSRRKLVRGLYDTNQKIIDENVIEFLDDQKMLYIVSRSKENSDKFIDNGLEEVFASDNGQFRLYRLKEE